MNNIEDAFSVKGTCKWRGNEGLYLIVRRSYDSEEDICTENPSLMVKKSI
jgi:hypothetical protein